MSLQGQRLCRSDDLEQKGQPRAERLDRGPANHLHRVMSDKLVQLFAAHHRRGEWMRAKPQLGLWFTGRLHAKELRDCCSRAPGVRLNHPRELLHHDSSCCGSASPTTACQRARVRATASESRQGTIGDSISPARRHRMTSWAWKV